MMWLPTGSAESPHFLFVSSSPFGAGCFSGLTRAFTEDFRMAVPDGSLPPTQEEILAAARSSAPQPVFAVLQGLAAPLLLPELARHSKLLTGVVILGGPGSAISARTADFGRWYVSNRQRLGELDPEDRLTLLLRRLGPGRQALSQQIVSALHHEAGSADLSALDAVMAMHPLDERPAASDVPALLVHGDSDRTMTRAGAGPELPRGFPDVRTVIMPGAGHLVALEATDLVASLIASFAREPIECWPRRRA